MYLSLTLGWSVHRHSPTITNQNHPKSKFLGGKVAAILFYFCMPFEIRMHSTIWKLNLVNIIRICSLYAFLYTRKIQYSRNSNNGHIQYLNSPSMADPLIVVLFKMASEKRTTSWKPELDPHYNDLNTRHPKSGFIWIPDFCVQFSNSWTI